MGFETKKYHLPVPIERMEININKEMGNLFDFWSFYESLRKCSVKMIPILTNKIIS